MRWGEIVDKIIFDNESLGFVADWLMDNKIFIQRVPQILPHYLIDYTVEMKDYKGVGKTFIECEWISDNAILHKSHIIRADGTRAKYEWVANFSYEDKTYQIVKTFSEILGKSEDEVHKQIMLDREGVNCNFEVGVTHTINGKEADDPYTGNDLHYCTTMTYLNIYVSYFIMNYEQEVIQYVDTERETVKPKKKSNGKKKSGGAKSVTTTVIRINKYVKEVKSGVKQLPRRKNNKCQYAFTVRRHIRHYKSGKTVEIQPYVKNKLADRIRREREIKLDLKRREKDEMHTGESNKCVSKA